MRKKSDNQVCKNKKCQKPLPEGYKYKYCEACRNKRADKTKKVIKGVGATVGTAAGVVVVILTKGRVFPKK